MTGFRVSQSRQQCLDPGSAMKGTTFVLALSSFVHHIQLSVFQMDK